MQHKKTWQKQVNGNHKIKQVKNPLRNFVQKVIPSIPLQNYPNRPKQQINLSIGDPTTSVQYRTHKNNLQSVSKAVGKIDGYTDVQGISSARQAIITKFATKVHKLTEKDVYLTLGGSLALWTVMNLLSNEGDNFLFPSPGFPLTLTIAKSMGLQPRFYHLQPNKNWEADLSQIQSLIDQRTKFILVNDPSNPLGSVWSAAYKRDIITLCIRKKIPLLADEIYEEMSYIDQVPTFAQLIQPQQVEQIAIYKCSGLTKRYLVPGWRMGWLILYAGQEYQRKMSPYLRGIFNVVLMPNSIVQNAIPQILSDDSNQKRMKECMDKMHLNQRALINGLEGQQYCTFGHSSGALYATILLNLQKFQQTKITDVIQFVKHLYAQQNIMVFPSNFFVGEVPFIRLVISCSLQKIEEFLLRFKRFCRKHLKK